LGVLAANQLTLFSDITDQQIVDLGAK